MHTSKASKLSHRIVDLLGRGETQETPPAPQFTTHTELADYHHGRTKGDAAILAGLNSTASPAKPSDDAADDAAGDAHQAWHQAWRTDLAALTPPAAWTSSTGSSETSSTSTESNAETTAPMLAALTTTETPWISNPVIVNAFDTTAFGSPDPSGLAFIPGATPGTQLFGDRDLPKTLRR